MRKKEFEIRPRVKMVLHAWYSIRRKLDEEVMGEKPLRYRGTRPQHLRRLSDTVHAAEALVGQILGQNTLLALAQMSILDLTIDL